MKNIVNKFILAGASGALAIASAYLIMPFEGEVVNKKGNHTVYRDIVGINTACWGQTGTDLDGKKLVTGATYTQEYCEEWYLEELTKYNKNMKRNVKVPLKEYEEVAYTSFIWNIGETKWNSSTLLQKLNAGDSIGACKELLRWNKATFNKRTADVQIKNGESCSTNKDGSYSCSVKGLTNRRMSEYNVCTNQNTEVSDALEALRVAAQAPINVDQGEDYYNAKEVVVDVPTPPPPIILPEVAPVVCKIKFLGICFKKGPAY
jgi:lysozyme